MHLTETELAFIFKECRRVLKHGGMNIYSVRNVNDPHYKKGTHRGEDMWENPMGFVVHFFSLEKVQRLAVGYDLLYTKEFEDTSPPFTKKLYEVVLLKP
jgi:predicted SAM-dependent methyltransferase